MKIHSLNEIESLDDDLNLFEETDWDFLSVLDNRDTNFEYFNDIRDTDFTRDFKTKFKENIFPIVSLIVVLSTCIFLSVRVSGVLDNEEYNSVLSMQSVGNNTSKVDKSASSNISSDKFLKISETLNSYFKCLRNKKNYDNLYKCCSATSTFADTYYNSTNKIKVLYDKNDCYARALRIFGSFYNLSRVNNVTYKDRVYYCKADLTYPLSSDIHEYISMYSYNFTKEFSKYVPTEASIVKYFLKLTDDNQIPCSTSSVNIKLIEKDGEFKIVDDSFITSNCIDAYTSSVNYITTILGTKIIKK